METNRDQMEYQTIERVNTEGKLHFILTVERLRPEEW